MVAAVERIEAFVAVFAGALFHFATTVGTDKEAGQRMRETGL